MVKYQKGYLNMAVSEKVNELYVGFKGVNNSSYRLVSRIGRDRLFLTNSFDGLARDIDGIKGEYSRIYMFGIDSRLGACVRIETCAALDGTTLYSNIDIPQICAAFDEAGIESHASKTPTSYLCNAAYFNMLERYGGNTVFTHIPSIKYAKDKFLDTVAGVFLNLK